MDTDKKLFVELMTLYGQNVEPKWQAPEYVKLSNSCNGDFASVVDMLYSKTIFSDETRFSRFISDFNLQASKGSTKIRFMRCQ